VSSGASSLIEALELELEKLLRGEAVYEYGNVSVCGQPERSSGREPQNRGSAAHLPALTQW